MRNKLFTIGLGLALCAGAVFYYAGILQPQFGQKTSLQVSSSANQEIKLKQEEVKIDAFAKNDTTSSELEKQIKISDESTSPASEVVKKDTLVLKGESIIPQASIPVDWGTVSVELGFSLRYPYKKIGAMWGDDEYFQVVFIFPPFLVSESATTSQQISRDMQNIRTQGLMLTVVDAKATTTDLKTWSVNYLKTGEGAYSYRNLSILSEEINPIQFSGKNGYIFTRKVKESESENGLNFTVSEIFIKDKQFVYQFNYPSVSENTVFLRSGKFGVEYLRQIEKISREVLGTFSFDGTKTTNIRVPKLIPKKLTGEAAVRREQLLTALRTPPYFDESASYNDISGGTKCDPGYSSVPGSIDSPNNLQTAQGLYFSAENGMMSDEDEKVVELHGYDKEGRHTGLMPEIPFGVKTYSLPEEGARNIDWVDMMAGRHSLSIREMIDGQIEMVGKKFSIVDFEIRGDGNSCSVVAMFIPVTPYSIATLPISVSGDIGPFSVDIDGDGRKDLEWSLRYPLLPKKMQELQTVIDDMSNQEK
jgi:hypothetical protein